ncbi:MAG TPA: peroxide stress protein YaaA [Alphaproteobacteria bacterium]|nr:peroxide stress protein YaaA [Alphaproteobacteria bacterium]
MLTVLLSPSKKLDESKTKISKASQLVFKDEALELAAIMKGYSKQDIQDLMSLSDNLTEVNYKRFQEFEKDFSLDKKAKQALYLFKGDVYDKMDVDGYSDSDLEFAQQRIRILSGLYGYVRPLDLIQPYRLEMGKKVANNNGKDLYAFWKDRTVHKINEENSNGTIINLASNEYFKSINTKELNANLVNVNMKQNKNGQIKTIGLMAKRARGLMADYIIKNRIEDVESLKNFDSEGYKYREDLSDDKHITFVLDM